MSKLTVQCRGLKYDVEQVAGTVYVHRTPTPDPGARGVQSFQPSEQIFAGSDEEANYIAQAILTVTGYSKPLEPKERVQLAEQGANESTAPASESKSDDQG